MNKLFEDFNSSTFKEWKNKVNFELSGKDFNETLSYNSIEGIKIPPYFSDDDGKKRLAYTRTTDSEIKVSSFFQLKNNSNSIKHLEIALKRDTDSIKLHIPENFNLKLLLPVKSLYKLNLHFDFDKFESQYIDIICELSDRQDPDKKIFLNLDPIGYLAVNGNWLNDEKNDLALLSTPKLLNTKNLIPFSVDISKYENAGANIVQQIAYALALSVEYAEIVGPVFFKKTIYNFSFANNFFFEISKLSVFEYLLEKIKNKYKVSSDNIISGESTIRNKTIYDTHNNLLRSTTEAFSAIIAGVNTFTPLPFDSIFNIDNTFSGNLAENQIHIIKEETNITNTNNIAEGSYILEYLKFQFAEASLDIFKLIENAGGFLSQIKNGVIQRKIRESAKKQQDLFNKGELTIIGANSFENSDEKINDSIRKYPFTKTKHAKIIVDKLHISRLSEKTEKQRLKNE